MRMILHGVPAALLAVALSISGPGVVRADDQESAPPPGSPTDEPAVLFVGVRACEQCHKSKATGNQIEPWKTSAHARAYETLGTEAAVAVAKQLGIDKPPQQVPRCLSCHTTGAGEVKSRFAEDFDVTQGVSCEACHGAGSEYSKIQHMIKHEKALAMGLQVADARTCKKCHNEKSPTFKGFDYASALKKIRHPLAPL